MDETRIDDAAQTPNTYTLFGVKRMWLIVSAACLLAAAVLGWRGQFDATFVTAALGVVAWFLDQRNLLRARSSAADIEDEEAKVTETDEQA